MQSDFDIVIVGGGLIGNCLALALKDSGLTIALIEAQTSEQLLLSPAGDRALALAKGTTTILDSIGIWQGIKHSACPITDIHVSDKGHFGKTRLSAEREGLDALGFVITARDIEAHISKLVDEAKIERICPALVNDLLLTEKNVQISLTHKDENYAVQACLLVGADGANSSVRNILGIGQQITDYAQIAVVTTIECSIPHHNTAFERFTQSGPLAFLPMDDRICSVVWTQSQHQAEQTKKASPEQLTSSLQNEFGYHLGELKLAGPVRFFPLSLVQSQSMIHHRSVIIGNAMHQLHPVAGQGFNLGLRDVAILAEMLIDRHQSGQDIGDYEFLKQYSEIRKSDLKKVIGFTHSLIRIFSNDWLWLAGVRNMGMTLLDVLPFGKTLLSKSAMGLNARLPRLGYRR